MDGDVVICATCGVEHARIVAVCAICADERQWVPAAGQRWTSIAELAAAGHASHVAELERDLLGVTIRPGVGIAQQSHVVCTPSGSLLWDPTGYVDEHAVERITALGDVVAIAASHPHMFGAQVAWSRALGGVPVLVAEADLEWVARPDRVIRPWAGAVEVLPGVTLTQLGGHFPGSSVVHWAAGAEGRGVLLGSDTIQSNPDRSSVTFMRSYPNRIPLSPAVVARMAAAASRLPFDRLYDNFGSTIDADAHAVVRRSAERYAGWARGAFDELT